MLHGEFIESTPQNLEFQVQYNNDLNTNVPALRVNHLEICNLNPVQSLLSNGGKRKVIPVVNGRFNDYHNIIYYIYTGSLNLRFPPSSYGKERPISSGVNAYGWELTPTFPRPANPNEVYRLAGMMGLAELQTRAYHYLMSTCSAENIFDRLFDPYCKAATHAPIRTIYQQFLARNWDKVRSSGQWAALLRRYRSTRHDDEAESLLDAICEILNALTWDHKIAKFLPITTYSTTA